MRQRWLRSSRYLARPDCYAGYDRGLVRSHEEVRMNQIYTPTVGSDIFTADRERLGVVKEVSGNYFKVNAPMQPDYWLPARQIVDIEEGQVRLGS